MQRAITKSEFDHIAMFLRLANGTLVYIEATSGAGVQIFSWEYLCNQSIFLSYQKMAFRKLRMDRDKKKLTALQNYVQKIRGSSYDLSISKLLKSKEEDEQIKTFFCSELVAACHKILGVLPQNVAASQYWPSTYALPG